MNEQESGRRHTLVIGGSHGISFDLVKQLLADGGQVTVVSRTRGRLNELGETDTGSLVHLQADVTSDELPLEQFPDRLDGFVFSPGSINLAPLRRATADALRQDFELNVIAAMKSFQASLPALKKSGGGSAVFFSTVAVDHGISMHTYVAAVKGALQALVKSWAAELAPTIRVNCIAPALTDTPLAHSLLSSEERRSAMAENYPLGRVGQPRDAAAAARFLLSNASSWMTGQVIRVDGGMSSIIRL